MNETTLIRVHRELEELLIEITEEINEGLPEKNQVPKVEVSRFVAEYLNTIDFKKLIRGFEDYQNGNGYHRKKILSNIGSGMSL